jgi:hypothetical protein
MIKARPKPVAFKREILQMIEPSGVEEGRNAQKRKKV